MAQQRVKGGAWARAPHIKGPTHLGTPDSIFITLKSIA